ncbi:MAG: c-type cytochrome domain-containing protein [Planctomycetia bacterium]
MRGQRSRFLRPPLMDGRLFLCVAIVSLVMPSPALAASPKEIKAAVDAAERSLADGQQADAASRLAEAIGGLEEAARVGTIPAGLRVLARRCETIRGKLDEAGVDVSSITVPSLTGAAKRPTGKAATSGPAAAKPAGVSFTKEIAPILVRACGSCHIAGKKGDFSIPSYAELARSGAVQRGEGEASRLVEVIVSGDMPRGGGKVSPEEITTLVRWIDAGAAYDGGDPMLPLTTWGQSGVQPAKPAITAAPVAVATLKPGDVSFATHVAPVLIEACLSCHGGFETEQGFNLATFPGLLRGGRSGAAIEPGTSADSLLVKKLRGMGIDGQRMPLGSDPLAADVIARIATWIDQGAKLDEATAGDSLQTIAAAGRARSLSDDQLAAVRREAGIAFWREFLPDEPPKVVNDGAVSVVGNLPASRVDAVAAVAGPAWRMLGEKLMPDQAGREGSPTGPVKGGVVVYALARSYDLSEFWQARYSTDRPRGANASAGVFGDVVYAALVVADDLDDGSDMKSDLAFAVAEQLGAAAFAARGAPAWFAEGAGRTLAGTIAPRAPLAKNWRKEIPEAVKSVGKGAGFFSGASDRATSATVAGGFVERLTANGKKLPAVIEALDAGAGFDEAFREVFREAPQPLFESWASQEAARNRRR